MIGEGERVQGGGVVQRFTVSEFQVSVILVAAGGDAERDAGGAFLLDGVEHGAIVGELEEGDAAALGLFFFCAGKKFEFRFPNDGNALGEKGAMDFVGGRGRAGVGGFKVGEHVAGANLGVV